MALEMPLLLKGEPGTGKNHAGACHRRKPAHAAHHPECQIQHEAD
jgi:transcriptional regulator of aromatic amino acid metabolism